MDDFVKIRSKDLYVEARLFFLPTIEMSGHAPG